MAHQAIYRKWRPMTFDDIIGQTHITKTIKNQILSGSVGHAYLFSGTRGTGKTTCAKVLSRAVNCLDPKNGNPCNECEICRGIIDGSIMDVTELDAASNNGVDDIRDIIGDISYIASSAKYTVYIIDEVHMLSNSAFNALLKTLEEPPGGVIFILATTEPHKVPQTILSRCQRFDFRRIRPEDIIIRMKEIAHTDGYEITEGAYRMLASLAEGSMRDGLSIMERVLASGGGTIDEAAVTAALGIAAQETVFSMADAIIKGSGAEVIGTLDRVVSDGKDLGQFAGAMLSHFRAMLVCSLTDTADVLPEYDAEALARLRAQSQSITFAKADHAVTLISKAMSDAKYARSQRIVYELAYLKLARPELDRDQSAIMDRLETVEQKLSSGVDLKPTAPPVNTAETAAIIKRLSAVEDAIKNGAVIGAKEKPEETVKKKKTSPRLYTPIPDEELSYDYPTAKLARGWNSTVEIMAQQNAPYVVPLKNSTVTFDADGLILLMPEDRRIFAERMAVAHLDEIRELFRRTTGTDYTIKIAMRDEFDERRILNAFDLPHRGAADAEAEPAAAKPVEDDGNTDKFDEFIKKFADIITDADKELSRADNITRGEQTTMDDLENDKEEFLETSEIMSDEDE
ncbi:MAG: DNA polymerase III subunit gamma/tau [Clostridia bacterium]|nr:DNA polymerase III subunit gamma/tau [Clostridia bacterium]